MLAEYLEGGISLRGLRRKYGIGHATIHRWFKAHEVGAQEEEGGGRRRRRSQAMLEMPKDVRRLERELYEERLRTKLLETMIEIAEREMGIPIRKKRGAK